MKGLLCYILGKGNFKEIVKHTHTHTHTKAQQKRRKEVPCELGQQLLLHMNQRYGLPQLQASGPLFPFCHKKAKNTANKTNPTTPNPKCPANLVPDKIVQTVQRNKKAYPYSPSSTMKFCFNKYQYKTQREREETVVP